MKQFDTPYGLANVVLTKYRDGNPAVILEDAEDEELIATLSVNIPDAAAGLKKGQFFAKTWSENEDIAALALASGLFKDTGARVPTGMVEAEVWEMTG